MSTRPNILLIVTDQQRPDFAGQSDVPVRTPHFDRLVERGVGFTNAICPSPLCGPSRISLATNTEYDDCGVQTNADYPGTVPTLYERLRSNAGYHTIGIGDIDLIRSPYWGLDGTNQLDDIGFNDGIEIPGKNAMMETYKHHISARANRHSEYDPEKVPSDLNPVAGEPATAYLAYLHNEGLLEDWIADMRKRMDSGWRTRYGTTDPCPLPHEAYVDNWVGRQGRRHIETAPREQPWFCMVNFVGPHDPLDVTEEMHAWYRDPDVEFPLPSEAERTFDDETHREIRRNYAAMCENYDRWLGRYLAVLEDRGELDETIVVFTSDHGEMLGDHGDWQKSTPFQPSIGIPMAIAGPGVKVRGTVDEPVSLLDLHPTILSAAGVDCGGDGVSLWPTLSGETADHRPVVSSGLDGARPFRVVFDGRYKLVVGDDLAAIEGFPDETTSPVLFDLEIDPDEQHDIAEETPDVVARLAERLPNGWTEAGPSYTGRQKP
jgi:arylsulfatase A-like enzyme